MKNTFFFFIWFPRFQRRRRSGRGSFRFGGTSLVCSDFTDKLKIYMLGILSSFGRSFVFRAMPRGSKGFDSASVHFSFFFEITFVSHNDEWDIFIFEILDSRDALTLFLQNIQAFR